MDSTTTDTTTTAPALALRRLEGYRVREISFVLDRLRIRFESPKGSAEQPELECVVLPSILMGTSVVSPADERWAGGLRALIGQDVTATYEEHGIGLRLEFPYGAMRIHPRPSQRDGSEVAHLRGFGDGEARCWRSGVECFADLHREVR